MRRRFTFVAVCFLLGSAAFGQNVPPASVHTPGARPITKTEGRKILASISSAADDDSESETDCSHLVHAVYEQAGFPYEYASSRELYTGSTNFTRVRVPHAGDLVVWLGHVGIVIDPKERSFFSFVRSGPDTQFYDSSYWRSRGIARFYRYVTEKPVRSGRTLEASRHADQEPLTIASNSSENRALPKSPKSASVAAPNSATATDASSLGTINANREIVVQVAGKNPAPDEVAAAFAEMNGNSAESLRTHGLNGSRKPIVVYREVRVSSVQTKGKRGTAIVSIESLGTLPNAQTGSKPRWKEQPLEFEKTKKGWVVSPIQEAAYLSREAALRVLSARLAEITRNTSATPEQEREQKQIIRLLNALVPDDSAAASEQNN